MKKLPRIINNSKELKDEKRNLFIVLAIFDLSYFVRMILDFTAYDKAFNGKDSAFKYYMVTIAPGILLDFLPITLVMWLHHESFKHGANTGLSQSMQTSADY